MKLQILDKLNEGNATCFLCKTDLSSFTESVPINYKDYVIQRSIVKNKFLDKLAETIKNKKHIPSIVLIGNEVELKNNQSLEIKDFAILDGLQRTHRLKVIWETLKFVEAQKIELSNISSVYRSHSNAFTEIGADLKLLRALSKLGCLGKKPEEFFADNYIWLEVWIGLTEEQQVEKMLLLNAGHKSVNIKHQLELLFLGTLFQLDQIAPKGVTFLREKSVSSIQYSKNRKLGQFHYSHLISALVSFSAGKIVNTNADFVSDLLSDGNDQIDLTDGFGLAFLKDFIDFLFRLDARLSVKYGDEGIQWLGREVVLIGLFAAIGEYLFNNENETLSSLSDDLIDDLTMSLDLKSFEEARNQVEINKVNLGDVNKKAVYLAAYDILREVPFKGWKDYFGDNK